MQFVDNDLNVFLFFSFLNQLWRRYYVHVMTGENDKQITIYYNIPNYNINNIIIVI